MDNFKYRYYFTGPSSDLQSLPSDPKPAASDYPFAMRCYVGCVSGDSDCVASASSGTTDGYAAEAKAGVVDVFISDAAEAVLGVCAAVDDGGDGGGDEEADGGDEGGDDDEDVGDDGDGDDLSAAGALSALAALGLLAML